MQLSPAGTVDNPPAGYEIIRFSKAGMRDLQKLHERVYGSTRDPGYYEKKYETGYTGHDYVGFLAYHKGTAVASLGIIPCYIQHNKQLILAGQAVDGMTDPEHRGKGFYVKLSSLAVDLAFNLGVELLFGFPNQFSHPLMKNYGAWTPYGKMDRFKIKPASGINSLFQKKRKFSFEFFPATTGFENPLIEQGFVGINRSAAYMQYKSFTDTVIVKSETADIWIKPAKSLVIGDIILKKNGKAEDTIRELRALAEQLNCSDIQFQVSPGCESHQFFASYVKPIPSFSIMVKDPMGKIKEGQLKFSYADLDIF